MAIFSETHCHVRSISMPTRSHPNCLNVEEVLRTTSESSKTLKADTVNMYLTDLAELYYCIEDLLQLSLIQQSLSRNFHEKQVQDVLNESMRLIDMCSTVNDLVSQMKDQAQDLQAALRRRGNEAAKKEKIQSYMSSRKIAKKNINRCLKELERIDTKCVSTSLGSEDKHFDFVMKVLKEAKDISVFFFRFLESLVYSTSLKPTTKRWSLVSKLIHNRQVACEEDAEKNKSDFEYVDAVVHSLSVQVSSKSEDVQMVEKVRKALKAMEKSTEDLEAGLQCLFKRFIQIRVSLLNSCAH